MTEKNIDEKTGIETTGHEWDGIRELNNPLPRWWLWVFYASIFYAVVYWILMPSWPGINDYAHGLVGNSERANVVADLDALHAEKRAAFIERMGAADSLSDIVADAELFQFAYAAGASAFGDNCATCHGAGAQGAPGYPNLNDDAWLWGGRLDDIQQTLRYGIRAQSDQTRYSEMLAFGANGILTREQIGDVAELVVALSGRDHDAAAAARARPLFERECVACHGADGRGDRSQGAPNLTDAVWLYGGDRQTIRETVWGGRKGVMPAWSERLEPWTVDALAIYVHSLGGGE